MILSERDIRNKYSRASNKLMGHLEHLLKMQFRLPVAPIHVSVWLNMKCQMHCEYCCCRKEERNDTELDLLTLLKTLKTLKKYGTKAIEFSGGGEPLLYESLPEVIDFCHKIDLKTSLITNGLLINSIPKETLDKLEWIRISAINMTQVSIIDYSRLKNVSLSYILKSDNSILYPLHELVLNNRLIVRVALPRPATKNQEIEASGIISKFGYPFFLTEKALGTPLGCYMAWIRAAIDWNGNFLVCPSPHLTDEYSGKIDKRFILCHIDNLEDWILKNAPHDLGYRCSFCNCGKEHNDMVHYILNKVDDGEFV